jgi:uncharacterized Fe-S cluster-containing radical SAM superfamily protein
VEDGLRAPLDCKKFRDRHWTTTGEPRAHIALGSLETLWFNTGTLCNLACAHCYIESSPTNDRLVFLSREEVAGYLDELEHEGFGTRIVGFTGGEPFMNPEMPGILEETLQRGFEALVLTNAMRPMMKAAGPLLELRRSFDDRLRIRVSLDHYASPHHEAERGPKSWTPAIEGLQWLARNGFSISVAGRLLSGEAEQVLRQRYGQLLHELGASLDPRDPQDLVLFPEMDQSLDVPEITEACWGILGVAPESVMCASSRMVLKRKGAEHPVVVSCTLLAHQPQFELGRRLADARGSVWLNHPHCARFCVLGGASCSR